MSQPSRTPDKLEELIFRLCSNDETKVRFREALEERRAHFLELAKSYALSAVFNPLEQRDNAVSCMGVMQEYDDLLAIVDRK